MQRSGPSFRASAIIFSKRTVHAPSVEVERAFVWHWSTLAVTTDRLVIKRYRADLESALGDLEPLDAQITGMKYYGGRPEKETGDSLIPYATVKSAASGLEEIVQGHGHRSADGAAGLCLGCLRLSGPAIFRCGTRLRYQQGPGERRLCAGGRRRSPPAADDGTVPTGTPLNYTPFSGNEYTDWNFRPGEYTLHIPCI